MDYFSSVNHEKDNALNDTAIQLNTFGRSVAAKRVFKI